MYKDTTTIETLEAAHAIGDEIKAQTNAVGPAIVQNMRASIRQGIDDFTCGNITTDMAGPIINGLHVMALVHILGPEAVTQLVQVSQLASDRLVEIFGPDIESLDS
jgi:hypothetical protein